MRPKIEIKSFPTRIIQAESLANEVVAIMDDAFSRKEYASMVVPGGKTPVLFFNELRNRKLPWDVIYIVPSDERWVDPDLVESNERMIRKNLLNDNSKFIPLKNVATTAEEGLAECTRNIAKIPQPFDVVILGMGSDGHIASVFPGMDYATPSACIAVNDAELPRISLSPATLLNSKRIILLVNGREKMQLIEKAIAGSCDGLPVCAILNQDKVPVEIYWAE